MLVLSLSLLSSFLLTRCQSAVQCLDNEGNAVDWYYVYKLNDGANYAYYDASSNENILTPLKSQTVYHNQESCIERTTNQVYDNRDSINWITYGDENGINDVTNYTCGHSKGILAFEKYDDSTENDFTGFWMLHSAPKFPNMSLESYYYPSNALEYAQNFLCVTIDSIDYIDAISKQLRYVMPWIWNGGSNNVNEDTRSLDNWNALLASEWLNGSSVVNLTSADVDNDNVVLNFNHLTRSGSENMDIFEDVVSSYYKKNFEWQTWQDSSSDEPIYCTPGYRYDEEDIEEVTFGDGWYTKNEDDHSKWGLASDNGNYNDNIVCSGDLNRATSQNKRGGGYACFENANFYDTLANTISQVQRCQP